MKPKPIVQVTRPEVLSLARRADAAGQRGLAAGLYALGGRLGPVVPGDADLDDGQGRFAAETRGLAASLRDERKAAAARPGRARLFPS